MNNKIGEFFEKLFSNEELADEFMQKDSIDEMYQFALTIVEGYTREEFEDFILSTIEYAMRFDPPQRLSDVELERAIGGVCPGNRSMYTGLCTMMSYEYESKRQINTRERMSEAVQNYRDKFPKLFHGKDATFEYETRTLGADVFDSFSILGSSPRK